MLTRLRDEARRRRALLGDEAGLTLAELIVTMSLMSIVGAMSLFFVVDMNQQADRTRVASVSVSDSRTALAAFTQAVQFADSPTAQPGSATGRFESIAANKIVFYSNGVNRSGAAVRTAPNKVVFSMTGGSFVQEVYAPKVATPADYTTNYNTTPTVRRTLIATVRSTSAFTFCSSAADAAGNCVTTTSPTAVAAVGLSLVVPGPSGQPDQSYSATATITGALQ